MNKSSVYLAIFAALCVLAGVLTGASITRRASLPGDWPGRPSFAEKAQRFMGYERGIGERMFGGGPVEMLASRLKLNPDQKAKVAIVLEKMRKDIDEVGRNVRSAISDIKDKSDKQIMNVLTPEQQKEFKALQKEFEKGRPRFPEGERGGPPGEHGPYPPGEPLAPRE